MSPDPVVRMQWIEPAPVAEDRVSEIRASLALPLDVCRLLVRRGIRSADEARAFLRPVLKDLHVPDALPDLPRALDRIEQAIDSGEGILVHGDYDADGMSAAALLTRGLERLGARVATFVPHRTRDGYDLAEAGLERAHSVGASLIVTADCGVTATAAVQRAAREGLDVVVTDHHRPGARLPEAVAVVDPMRRDSDYPFSDLAGVGVAFKLLTALFRRAGVPQPELNQHLDLVAIGTVADQMPLVGENRILVRAGLRALGRSRKPGVRALLSRSGVPAGGDVEAEHIAYRLAPRLNAVGRMAAAEAGLRVLLTEDPAEAQRLTRHLDDQNTERRRADKDLYGEVEALLSTRFDPETDRAVVLWGDDWHPGVIGIVASRLVERFRRPAVVVTFDGEVGRGSGRSVDGFHLYEALQECDDLLDRYGGHRMAAGISILRAHMEEFAGRFQALAARRLESSDLVERIRLDLVLSLGEVERDLHRWLRYLAPFGAGNPAPVLAARDVALERVARVGADGGHLRAVLADGQKHLPAIGFGLGPRSTEVTGSLRYDVAFALAESRWNGRRELQARILDFRPTEP